MWARGNVVVVAAAVAALSACGGGVRNDSHVPHQSAPGGGGSSAAADPADLIGSWFLDAPGEPGGAMLSIGDPVEQGILLFRPCGALDLLWRANRDGMLLMRTGGGDGSCYLPAGEHPRPDPGWVTDVVSFRADGSAELLLDQDGHTVARLT